MSVRNAHSPIMSTDIRKFREARGWSRKDLADRIGVHQSTIFRMERKEKIPRRVEIVLDAIADAEKAEPAA